MSEIALLIVGRNFGDAVISTAFLNRMSLLNSDLHWHVWCRPEVRFLFEAQQNTIKVSVSEFPMGTVKKFGLRNALRFMQQVARLRLSRFAFTVDLVGDFREALLGVLVGNFRHYSARWPADHAYSGIIRKAPGWWPVRWVSIPPSAKNIYSAYASFAHQLASLRGFPASLESGSAEISRLSDEAQNSKSLRGALIGIHPFASQPCKLWVNWKWQALIASLQAKGAEIRLFGAPSERDPLIELASGFLRESAIITVAMPDFFISISKLSLLIGLDSFSIHAAHYSGVPSIMINGSNDPTLFVPPTATRLDYAANCGAQPCMNVPICVGTAAKYSCTSGVAVESVIDKVISSLVPSPS